MRRPDSRPTWRGTRTRFAPTGIVTGCDSRRADHRRPHPEPCPAKAVYASGVGISRLCLDMSELPEMMKARLTRTSLLAALLVWTWSAPLSAAGYLYRYKDANGRPVISRSIPPEFVDEGYEVLTEQMRIVRVVPPADVREKMMEEEKARAQQLENDRRLLRSYTSAQEAEESRDRKVQELELFIDTRTNGVDRLQKSLANALQDAADTERRGKEVSPELLKNIEAIKVQIHEEQVKLDSMREELQEVRGRYADDIERLRELLGDGDVSALRE